MAVSFAQIEIGSTYSRQLLAERWGYRSYQALARGVVTPKSDNKIILFVTAEKQSSFEQYADRLDNGVLEWEGPTDHFGEDRIASAAATGDEIHLFYRTRHHSEFLYCGRIEVDEHVRRKVRPSRFVFRVPFSDRPINRDSARGAPQPWSRREVEVLVSDYVSMLAAELRHEDYSKTAHRRAVAPLLKARTDGSIERKHQNVSAVLIELGFPYISGYKPLSNYQALLFDVVADRVGNDRSLAGTVRAAVEAPAASPPVDDLLGRLEEPPEPVTPTSYREIRERQRKIRSSVNWLEIEARNTSLGRAGEEFALRFERARLLKAGKAGLADRIEHVSVTSGDGEGFDIRSFEVNGIDRLIEVKTTAYGKQTPFFLSRNELDVSQRRAVAYHLYRLFRFSRNPGLYILNGRLADSCYLDPIQFRARFE